MNACLSTRTAARRSKHPAAKSGRFTYSFEPQRDCEEQVVRRSDGLRAFWVPSLGTVRLWGESQWTPTGRDCKDEAAVRLCLDRVS